MKYKSASTLTILIIMQLLCSCNDLDQVEKKYETYKLAEEDHLFDRGWIAKGLIFNSMETIYLKSNIDLNTYFFSYKLSVDDSQKLMQKLKPINRTKPFPHGIDVPNRFENQMQSLRQYVYVEKDTIYIKVDNRSKLIFGWSR